MSNVIQAAKSAASISEFCASHDICRATYYNLEKRGLAPITMAVGSRRLISAEAAEAWRRRMEQREGTLPSPKRRDRSADRAAPRTEAGHA